MTAEPARLAYLDAMGLTAWVARYQLPNARESEACEWPQAEPEAPRRVGADSLHALLSDNEAATALTAEVPGEAGPPSAQKAESAPRAPQGQRKARALLGDFALDSAPDGTPIDEPSSPAPPASGAPDVPATASASAAAQQALRFECQVGCLDGRWLMLVAQSAPLASAHQRLLVNLLRAGGVAPEQRPSFEALRWPLDEGLAVRQPQDEARQGLAAFIAGRRRRGWSPERVLVFGEDAALGEVLDVQDGASQTLALPLWQMPSLDALLEGAEAKRRLWPTLRRWREAWGQE
ncbi:hypothetical protein ACUN9Y_05515 [Halomonas sp. V046]|uniref:hypothetical protein n=1 Tax=Halomonas sp. V046 TaxID=3459611 RepID=UPI004044EA6A